MFKNSIIKRLRNRRVYVNVFYTALLLCLLLLFSLLNFDFSIFKFCYSISCVRYFYFFSPNDSPSKAMKNVLKSFFRFQDIQIFVIFFLSFSHFPDSKGQLKVG